MLSCSWSTSSGLMLVRILGSLGMSLNLTRTVVPGRRDRGLTCNNPLPVKVGPRVRCVAAKVRSARMPAQQQGHASRNETSSPAASEARRVSPPQYRRGVARRHRLPSQLGPLHAGGPWPAVTCPSLTRTGHGIGVDGVCERGVVEVHDDHGDAAVEDSFLKLGRPAQACSSRGLGRGRLGPAVQGVASRRLTASKHGRHASRATG